MVSVRCSVIVLLAMCAGAQASCHTDSYGLTVGHEHQLKDQLSYLKDFSVQLNSDPLPCYNAIGSTVTVCGNDYAPLTVRMEELFYATVRRPAPSREPVNIYATLYCTDQYPLTQGGQGAALGAQGAAPAARPKVTALGKGRY